jgi:acetyl-CoA carboxylase carboxyltransferase component
VIATANANIGMGGPAMVEGGGSGSCLRRKKSVRCRAAGERRSRHRRPDEAEAVRVAKRYLSYFQGPLGALARYEAADQRAMRQIIPENRLRVYDVRTIIETLSDTDWVLELRREFARGMVTSLIRVEGRTVGVIANDPRFLGGAIDSTAPTRQRASCSCATRTTSRCYSCAIRRASWSGRRSRRPLWCVTPVACS